MPVDHGGHDGVTLSVMHMPHGSQPILRAFPHTPRGFQPVLHAEGIQVNEAVLVSPQHAGQLTIQPFRFLLQCHPLCLHILQLVRHLSQVLLQPPGLWAKGENRSRTTRDKSFQNASPTFSKEHGRCCRTFPRSHFTHLTFAYFMCL